MNLIAHRRPLSNLSKQVIKVPKILIEILKLCKSMDCSEYPKYKEIESLCKTIDISLEDLICLAAQNVDSKKSYCADYCTTDSSLDNNIADVTMPGLAGTSSITKCVFFANYDRRFKSKQTKTPKMLCNNSGQKYVQYNTNASSIPSDCCCNCKNKKSFEFDKKKMKNLLLALLGVTHPCQDRNLLADDLNKISSMYFIFKT